MKARGKGRGFTLIETVVTITVIAIIAAVAVPAMIDISPGQDAGPLEPLRALLIEAKREALATGRPVEVVVVPGSGRYEVIGATSAKLRSSGVLPLHGIRSRNPSDRFRVVFNPVGVGVGDTLAAAGVVLRVRTGVGEIVVDR